MFDQISVRCVALKFRGAAGPSGLDASAWKHMYTCFQVVSDDSCEACLHFPGDYVLSFLTLQVCPPLFLAA